MSTHPADEMEAILMIRLAKSVDDLLFEKKIQDRRHAELAALVAKLMVAVETLERRVETLVRLRLGQPLQETS